MVRPPLHSWLATTFSNILERKGRFEIGLELSRSPWSRFGFLMSGLITASLKAVGTYPNSRDELKVL